MEEAHGDPGFAHFLWGWFSHLAWFYHARFPAEWRELREQQSDYCGASEPRNRVFVQLPF